MCVHVQVQAKALRGVGAALPALAAGALGSPGTAAAIDAFLDAVDGACSATEPTEMRAAAVQGLQASSLLQPAAAGRGEACLWSAAALHSSMEHPPVMLWAQITIILALLCCNVRLLNSHIPAASTVLQPLNHTLPAPLHVSAIGVLPRPRGASIPHLSDDDVDHVQARP